VVARPHFTAAPHVLANGLTGDQGDGHTNLAANGGRPCAETSIRVELAVGLGGEDLAADFPDHCSPARLNAPHVDRCRSISEGLASSNRPETLANAGAWRAEGKSVGMELRGRGEPVATKLVGMLVDDRVGVGRAAACVGTRRLVPPMACGEMARLVRWQIATSMAAYSLPMRCRT
jgi:hypothetical protein